MSSLRSQVERTLRQLGVSRGETILIAMSGGPDSFALAASLASLRNDWSFALLAATVHHGLRESAQQDCDVAGEQAAALGMDIATLHLHIEPGASVMERARNERYRALLNHAKDRGAKFLAVGHTEDDQAETVLMRILRGTSLLGLASIQAAREDGVIRPLLFTARTHVHAFANRTARELSVRIANDPTNLDAKHLRTRTRTLLSQLRSENGNIGKTLGRLADEASELRQWLNELADEWLRNNANAQGIPHRPWLALATPLRTATLRLWLKRQHGLDLEIEHLDAIRKIRASSDIPLSSAQRVRLADGFIQVALVSELR